MARNLIQKLDSALAAGLKGYRSGLHMGPHSGMVLGFVVSDEFRGKDQIARQKKLRKIIDGAVSQPELEKIGPLVAMTHAEANFGEMAA